MTSNRGQFGEQPIVHGWLLARVGRWDEAQALLEDCGNGSPAFCRSDLAYVLASQGHRDEAYGALGLTAAPDSRFIRAWLEAALGEPERAMEALRQLGPMERGLLTDLHSITGSGRCGTILRFRNLSGRPGRSGPARFANPDLNSVSPRPFSTEPRLPPVGLRLLLQRLLIPLPVQNVGQYVIPLVTRVFVHPVVQRPERDLASPRQSQLIRPCVNRYINPY